MAAFIFIFCTVLPPCWRCWRLSDEFEKNSLAAKPCKPCWLGFVGLRQPSPQPSPASGRGGNGEGRLFRSGVYPMNGILLQLLQNALVVLIAPLLLGWVNQCRAWLQNRSGAGVLQPYRNLIKLFHKDAVLAHNASPLFRFTPYILFATMWLVDSLVTE